MTFLSLQLHLGTSQINLMKWINLILEYYSTDLFSLNNSSFGKSPSLQGETFSLYMCAYVYVCMCAFYFLFIRFINHLTPEAKQDVYKISQNTKKTLIK